MIFFRISQLVIDDSIDTRVTSWENLFILYVNNKGADQPVHPRNLNIGFVVRWLDSIIPLVSISEISSLYLASEYAQAGLCLTWSQTSNTGFLVTILTSEPSVLPVSFVVVVIYDFLDLY